MARTKRQVIRKSVAEAIRAKKRTMTKAQNKEREVSLGKLETKRAQKNETKEAKTDAPKTRHMSRGVSTWRKIKRLQRDVNGKMIPARCLYRLAKATWGHIADEFKRDRENNPALKEEKVIEDFKIKPEAFKMLLDVSTRRLLNTFVVAKAIKMFASDKQGDAKREGTNQWCAANANTRFEKKFASIKKADDRKKAIKLAQDRFEAEARCRGFLIYRDSDKLNRRQLEAAQLLIERGAHFVT